MLKIQHKHNSQRKFYFYHNSKFHCTFQNFHFKRKAKKILRTMKTIQRRKTMINCVNSAERTCLMFFNLSVLITKFSQNLIIRSR